MSPSRLDEMARSDWVHQWTVRLQQRGRPVADEPWLDRHEIDFRRITLSNPRYVGRPLHELRIDVLLAHRTLPAAALTTAMDTALATGVLDPASVIIDARRAAEPPLAPVIAIDTLARYDRPAPTLESYDDLLAGGDR